MNKDCLELLFKSLSSNQSLEKLTLARTNINQAKPLQLFLNFLSQDSLTELDISLCGFNTQQLAEIWRTLSSRSPVMQALNLSNN
jgi:hypothetical protein